MQKKAIERWNCTRCGGDLASFKLHKLVHIHAWDVTAFVGHWPAFDAAFVVFRGTDSGDFWNWVENIEVITRPYYDLPFPGAAPGRPSVPFPWYCRVVPLACPSKMHTNNPQVPQSTPA